MHAYSPWPHCCAWARKQERRSRTLHAIRGRHKTGPALVWTPPGLPIALCSVRAGRAGKPSSTPCLHPWVTPRAEHPLGEPDPPHATAPQPWLRCSGCSSPTFTGSACRGWVPVLEVLLGTDLDLLGTALPDLGDQNTTTHQLLVGVFKPLCRQEP